MMGQGECGHLSSVGGSRCTYMNKVPDLAAPLVKWRGPKRIDKSAVYETHHRVARRPKPSPCYAQSDSIIKGFRSLASKEMEE